MRTFLHILALMMTFIMVSSAQIGGNALKFDGSNDYVDCNTTISVSGDLTVSAWILSYGIDGNDYIVVKGNDNGQNGSFGIGLSGDTNTHAMFMFYDTQDGVRWVNSPDGAIETNKWYHIAGVISGSNTYIYVNGKLVGSNTINGSISSTSLKANIGKQERSGYEYYFNGLIDEVQIWDKALTETDIKAAMYKELAGSESELVAYYKMSNGSGTSLSDDSQNDHTGALMNGPIWTASGAFAGPRNCLDFDGIDEYVNLANIHPGNSFAISAWIYDESNGSGDGMIVGKDFSYFLWIQAGNLRGEFCATYGGWEGQVIYYDFSDKYGNKWTNVALIKDYENSKLQLVINGMVVHSIDIGLTVYDESVNSCIGRSPWYGRYFIGKIDEVSIWNMALPLAQIKETMMRNLVGNESGLIAYYRFDCSDGTALLDLSSNTYNGTLVNMETTDWVSSSAFNVWIGNESSVWSTANNWSRNSVPDSTENIGIYAWNLGNEASITGNPKIDNMLISAVASPSLNSGVTIKGYLILENDLDLSGQTITLSKDAYLIEGSGLLHGTSGTISITRNLNSGASNENIGWLGAYITTSANLGTTVITRGHAVKTGGGNTGIKRYYQINPQYNSSLDATLVFNYLESELNGISEPNLRLFKSTNGTDWTSEGGSVDTANNEVTLSGIDSFSYWTLGDVSSPLPVELSMLKAERGVDHVVLKWRTETEVNNYGFEVEKCRMERPGIRSRSSEWRTIGFIPGVGTSNSPKEYFFIDSKLSAGCRAYRLKQIDLNGSIEYSRAIELEIGESKEFTLEQNYPNPFNPTTTIAFTLAEDGLSTLKVYNVLGCEVATLINGELSAGVLYNVEFDASKLTSGLYLCRLESGKQYFVRKILLMK